MKRPLASSTFGRRLLLRRNGNNFDALRLIAAFMVVFGHAHLIGLGHCENEPLFHITSGVVNSGSLAIAVFFVISGFLITKSYEEASSAPAFVAHRVLRIVPALALAVVLSAFVLGPAVSELSVGQYFAERAPYQYLFRFFSIQEGLPGVFVHNPLPSTINGSVWTLREEALCYLLVLALGLARALRWQSLLGVLLLCLLGRYLTDSVAVYRALDPYFAYRNLLFHVGAFAAGALFYLLRDRIPQSGPLAALAAGLTALAAWVGTASFHVVFTLAGSYAVICLALSRRVPLRGWGQYGDFSYGVYVFSFPLQQLAAQWLLPFQAWWLNLGYSLPLIVLAAFGSWHGVEKRALALKRWLARPPAVGPASAAASHPHATKDRRSMQAVSGVRDAG